MLMAINTECRLVVVTLEYVCQPRRHAEPLTDVLIQTVTVR